MIPLLRNAPQTFFGGIAVRLVHTKDITVRCILEKSQTKSAREAKLSALTYRQIRRYFAPWAW
jgi:hypothetical protein